MALMRWEPRDVASLQNEMNRLFGSFFDRRDTGHWAPAVDLVETDGDIVLRADLPGLTEKDVNIEMSEGVLTISGERRREHEEKEEGFYRMERSYGRFSRSVRLPEGIDPESIKARFEQGVLEVRVPRPREPQPFRVPISIEGTASE